MMLNENVVYGSYGDYVVKFNIKSGEFEIQCNTPEIALKNGKITSKSPKALSDYSTDVKYKWSDDEMFRTITYLDGDEEIHILNFVLKNDKISVVNKGKYPLFFECDVCIGKEGDEGVFAMTDKPLSGTVRTACGFASAVGDNMVFDRNTDKAIFVEDNETIRFNYNYDRGRYVCTALLSGTGRNNAVTTYSKNDIQANQFKIHYAPINKNTVFQKAPPIGFMTWYAVMFDACEEIVLKNAEWQSKNLKRYGANAIWVDWEWYHKDFGERDDGVNCFVPDPEKYPNGMGYLADKIKELGLTPSLWIGFTNDPSMNSYAKENPDMILCEDVNWSGRYFYDYTHPKFINEFLPMALNQVLDWGYEAIKFDTLPDSYWLQEIYHHKLYDPTKTTRDAFRNMIAKTRSVVGDKCYMLSCGHLRDSDFLWAADIFDAGRVGVDLFSWHQFLTGGIDLALRYYPLHNTVLYCDMDCVVLRDEFNQNMKQAASRVYMVSLLGLPMTFGDVLYELPEEKVDLIKECLPTLDIHPMCAVPPKNDQEILIVNMFVNKPYDQYNVIDFFNTTDYRIPNKVISLKNDILLDDSQYHVYDYTNKEYLGCVDSSYQEITLEFEPFESRVICIKKKTDKPQLISTSRHISQGAAEISDMVWDNNTLKITADLLEGVEYTMTFFVPDGYKLTASNSADKVEENGNITTLTILPKKDGKTEISVAF